MQWGAPQPFEDAAVAGPGQRLGGGEEDGRPLLVPQAEHGHGDEGLGDRADPVLRARVGCPPTDRTGGTGPGEFAVPDDAGDDGRQAGVGLFAGQAQVEAGTAGVVETRHGGPR